MPAAPPVKSAGRPPGNRILLVAIALTGIVAFVQLGGLLWERMGRESAAASSEVVEAESAPAAAATPAVEADAILQQEALEAEAAAAEAELAAVEAEKQLVAKKSEERLVAAALPKPTPLPAASQHENMVEVRVNALVQLARTLRDRGDTATALTRLREAQALSAENALVISEMAMIYEKMGLHLKALDQWRRIVEFGEKAGIYYAAAEAKLRAAEMAIAAPAFPDYEPSLIPEDFQYRPPMLSLDRPGTVEDTGNSQVNRRLKLRIPIKALPGLPVESEEVVIQVYFYDRLQDGSLEETNAEVESVWLRRQNPDGSLASIDWSSGHPEILEVSYAQQPEAPDAEGRFQTGRRNYFGYVVHVYYKGQLNATHSDQERLLTDFPAPLTLQPSDDLL